MPHVFRSDIQENEISVMQTLFFFNSFGKDFFELHTFRSIHPIMESSKNGFIIHNAPKKVVKYFKKLKKADSYSHFILFLDILKWLSTSEYIPLSNYLSQKKITDNEGKRIQIVFEYVMTNFHKSITLDEIAR